MHDPQKMVEHLMIAKHFIVLSQTIGMGDLHSYSHSGLTPNSVGNEDICLFQKLIPIENKAWKRH